MKVANALTQTRDQARRPGLAMFATGRRSTRGDRIGGRRLHHRCIFIQNGLHDHRANGLIRTGGVGQSPAGVAKLLFVSPAGHFARRSVSVVRARADAYGYFVGAGLYRCDRAPPSVQRCLHARLRRPFVENAGISSMARSTCKHVTVQVSAVRGDGIAVRGCSKTR